MSQAPYTSYPASDQQQSLPPVPAKKSSLLSILSFPLSAIALLFVPILFGGVAILLASIGKFSRREPLGTVAFVVAIVATVIGVVLGAIVGMMSAVA